MKRSCSNEWNHDKLATDLCRWLMQRTKDPDEGIHVLGATICLLAHGSAEIKAQEKKRK